MKQCNSNANKSTSRLRYFTMTGKCRIRIICRWCAKREGIYFNNFVIECYLLKSSIIEYDHILSHFVFDCLSLTSWNPWVPIPVIAKRRRFDKTIWRLRQSCIMCGAVCATNHDRWAHQWWFALLCQILSARSGQTYWHDPWNLSSKQWLCWRGWGHTSRKLYQGDLQDRGK